MCVDCLRDKALKTNTRIILNLLLEGFWNVSATGVFLLTVNAHNTHCLERKER